MYEKSNIIAMAAVCAAMLAGAAVAQADGSMPGMRGHDHTGITVPDMKQAVDFFIDVLGCKKAMSFGPFADDKGTFMQDAARRRSEGGDQADHAGALRLSARTSSCSNIPRRTRRT